MSGMRFTFNAPRPILQLEEDEKNMRYAWFPFPLSLFVVLYDEWKQRVEP
jgi:hypothetical protein